MKDYKIEDTGSKRVLVIDGNRYETIYSKKVIELVIERKGLERAPEYFVHKENREYLFAPLFKYLTSKKGKDLKVLEVGCSAGQFTELLNEQASIGEIYCYDIDKIMVEVTKTKVEELGLKKVKRVDCFPSEETLKLPYLNDYFDLIILSAVMEHLPFENRHLQVDEYYRKLKIGGLICFLDTPNRNYPIETHSVGLPFINRFPPQAAFIYAKLFGKLKGIDFPEFVRPGTAWRNATYYECLPKSLTIEIKDISEEAGYGYALFMSIPRSLKFRIFISPTFKLLNLIAKRLSFPMSFFLPYLNLVFKKTFNFEKEQ